MTPPPDPGDAARTDPRISEIVAALRDLRLKSHRARYGDALLPDLPSKKAVAEIV